MNTVVRILYVDDYPLDRELVRDALEKDEGGFEVTEACSREEFEREIQRTDFDVVLSDFNILGFEGLQVLEAVHARDPHLPVIIVTGTGSEEVAAEAIKRGAADYVIKTPAHIRRLGMTIRKALEKVRLESESEETKEALDQSNELLTLFIMHSPIYAYIKQVSTDESRVLIASENYKEMVGIAGSKMAGKTMDELFPAEFAAKMTADDMAVVADGTVLKLNEDLNGRHYTTIKFPINIGTRHLLAGYTIDITENKQKEEQLQRRLQDLQVLYQSSLDLSSELTPHEIGRKVIQIIKTNLNWRYALVRLKQEENGLLETIGYTAPGVTEENVGNEIERLQGLINDGRRGITGWVLEHGEAIRSGNLTADPRYVAAYVGLNSGMYAPMVAGGKVIGVIAIETEALDAFNELDERLLVTVAKITANSIHRSRLRQQTDLQVQRLGALRAIDQAISASFDLHTTLDIFLRNAVSQLGADAALVLLMNPVLNMLEYAAEHGFRNRNVRRVRLHVGEEGAGHVAMDRRMLFIPDLEKEATLRIHPDLAESERFVTYHAIPLIVKGQVKGVLEIFHRKRLDFTPEWFDFLETLAGQAAIAIDNNQLFESLQRTNLELAIAYDETIEGWSTALDMRDRETEGHTQRVTQLTQALASSRGMSETELVHIRWGALLHDIGKMGVPDSILLKAGPLTDEEWTVMRRHPQLAYDMLSPIVYLREAVDIPYCHHEKWDGSGYPRGLKGDQIPLSARLFAVVDVWDALRSDRPYRKSWPEEKVREYIRAQASTHFDPQAVKLFFRVLET